ncbi:hypothetical protein [Falsibacillus pallidus]|uniref:hypothetical protein n=1 Tax=Falsibacillus pallidus TaxID=493781 RepID=UPI003D9613FB
MDVIMIETNQISEIFYHPYFSKPGLHRIRRFYKYFQYVEGISIVEEIDYKKFRLITHCENVECFNSENSNLYVINKKFQNDEDRYLEVLKFLVDGKSNSSFKDKYYVLNRLILTIPLEEVSERVEIPIKELKPYVFKENDYKEYLETALISGNYTKMNKLVSFLQKNKWICNSSRLLLINLILKDTEGLPKLTDSRWIIVKFTLEGIQTKFTELTSLQQKEILKEIIRDGWTVLIDYFSQRCDEVK